jgi:hypothetical protein
VLFQCRVSSRRIWATLGGLNIIFVDGPCNLDVGDVETPLYRFQARDARKRGGGGRHTGPYYINKGLLRVSSRPL